MATKGGKGSGAAVARPAVVERLKADGFRQRGDEWSGSCPHPDHDDEKPSWSYNQQKDAFNCLGCGWSGNGAELAAVLGIDATEPETAARTTGRLGPIVATYDYENEDGVLLFQVVRHEPKAFRQRRPGTGSGLARGWIENVKGVRRVPYRLRSLLDAIARGERVYLTEGEKDANTLHALGYTATAVAGGATAWRDEYAQYFAGGDVTICPDDDQPGYQFGIAAAAALLRAGVRVRWCRLPKDATDWLTRHTDTELRAAFDAAHHIASEADLPPDPHAAGIVVLDVGAGELAAQQFRPREPIVSPIIDRQGLAMLYGPRGILKTQLAVGIATAASTGTPFLRFAVPQPRRVLYIDGELQGWRVQELFTQALARLRPGTTPAPGFLRLITPDAQPTLFAPNLADEAAQRLLSPHLDGVDLVVLDNLSALLRGDENEAGAYDTMQAFMLQLRQRGVAVLILHHANKTGDQRGTSKREDLLDTVMRLSRPAGYTPEDGAWATLEFTKSRGFWGADAAPFEIWLETDASGRSTWHHGERAYAQADQLRSELAKGKTVTAAAKAAKVSRATAYRRLKVVEPEQARRRPASGNRRRKY